MKSRFLFPSHYRKIGWLITVPAIVLGIANLYYDFEFDFLAIKFIELSDSIFNEQINLTDELATLAVILGLSLIAFSKEEMEDERIAQIRMESLQWAVYVNYIVLALAVLLVHGGDFLWVMVYNMFTVLLFFVLRFRWMIYRDNQLNQ